MININYNTDEIEKKCFDALISLMMKKPIDQCHTAEILELANISKSTFYRHYLDKYDLLNKSYDALLKNTFFEIHDGISFKQTFIQLYEALRSNHQFFHNAFLSQGPNSLKASIYKAMETSFIDILSNHGIDMKDTYNRYLLEGYLTGTLQITYSWIDSGAKENCDEILKLIYTLMPEQIKLVIMLNYM